jgi:hypothetical protein
VYGENGKVSFLQRTTMRRAMTEKRFIVEISSPPDSEKLVADILFGDRDYREQWAELNQEDGTVRIEFYPKRDGTFWKFDFEEVMGALNEAKRQLTGI